MKNPRVETLSPKKSTRLDGKKPPSRGRERNAGWLRAWTLRAGGGGARGNPWEKGWKVRLENVQFGERFALVQGFAWMWLYRCRASSIASSTTSPGILLGPVCGSVGGYKRAATIVPSVA